MLEVSSQDTQINEFIVESRGHPAWLLMIFELDLWNEER